MIAVDRRLVALPQNAPAAPETAARFCAWCEAELAPGKRAHAVTCSKACRQKRARLAQAMKRRRRALARAQRTVSKVSRIRLEAANVRTRPLLSSVARDRALAGAHAEELLCTNGVQLEAPTRYGVVVGGAKGVTID